MDMNVPKTGLLLNESDLKLHRQWFEELVELLGIKIIYRAPKPDKHYTFYSEVESNYQAPELVGCIFQDHPDQQTLKKMGWVSELQENASIIHLPYDLHDLQAGALCIIPSGLDHAQGRVFRITKLSTIMVYPASVACEIIPEYENALPNNAALDFSKSNFNLLREEDEE